MKHFTLLLMAAATLCSPAIAQNRVKNLYTYSNALNISALENETQPVQINRTLYAGYNSICLPMSLNAEQLQEAAKDVQIERFFSITQEDNTLKLNFIDCTNEGIEAGVPYLIYSPTLQTLRANTNNSKAVNTELKSVTKADAEGNLVTFGSSWESVKVDGRYGIPAMQDNDILQSVLVRTEGDKTFLPTRCGFTWDKKSSTASAIEIKHITELSGEATSIESLQAADACVDIYNAQGTLIQKQTNINNAINSLPRGIYVIKGLKVSVK